MYEFIILNIMKSKIFIYKRKEKIEKVKKEVLFQKHILILMENIPL